MDTKISGLLFEGEQLMLAALPRTASEKFREAITKSQLLESTTSSNQLTSFCQAQLARACAFACVHEEDAALRKEASDLISTLNTDNLDSVHDLEKRLNVAQALFLLGSYQEAELRCQPLVQGAWNTVLNDNSAHYEKYFDSVMLMLSILFLQNRSVEALQLSAALPDAYLCRRMDAKSPELLSQHKMKLESDFYRMLPHSWGEVIRFLLWQNPSLEADISKVRYEYDAILWELVRSSMNHLWSEGVFYFVFREAKGQLATADFWASMLQVASSMGCLAITAMLCHHMDKSKTDVLMRSGLPNRHLCGICKGHVFHSPLHAAAFHGRLEPLRLFLQLWPQIDGDEGSKRVFEWQCSHGAIEGNQLNIIQWLLTEQHWRPELELVNRAMSNDQLALAKLLIDTETTGFDPNAFYEDLRLLHRACSHNNIPTAQFLISVGADVDALDKKGRTPLFISVLERSDAAVQLLLQHGAQVDKRSGITFYGGLTPPHGGWTDLTPLELRMVLLPQEDARDADAAVFDALMGCGADRSRVFGNGRTMLHFAVLTKDERALKGLLRDARPEMVNVVDAEGNGAADLALENEFTAGRDLLVRCGARHPVMPKRGKERKSVSKKLKFWK